MCHIILQLETFNKESDTVFLCHNLQLNSNDSNKTFLVWWYQKATNPSFLRNPNKKLHLRFKIRMQPLTEIMNHLDEHNAKYKFAFSSLMKTKENNFEIKQQIC